MPFYDAGDAAIFYEREGNGQPLILLHGYALNGLMWEFQRQALARANDLITVDLRGFGRSSCSQSWSGAVMASDIIGLARSLNLGQVAILGFSMSGPVAVRVAYELPGVVSRLILASSILPSRGRPRSAREEEANQRELEILQQHGIEGWAEAIGFSSGPLVERMFGRNPDVVPLWKRILERHNPHYLSCMMAARLSTPSKVDWRSRLKEIKQKTLVIAGARDRRFIDAARHLASDIPDAELTIIENAGHMANLEAPREFERAVLDFLAKK